MGEASESRKRVPALNKFMHPRNPYRTPPSFKQIATLYPDFRRHCTYDVEGKVRLDFSQRRALAQLAIALMHKDFGLTVELPDDRLVPTIPLRLNYLLWLQDLVGLWAKRVKPDEFDLNKAIELQQQQKKEQKHEQQSEQQDQLHQAKESHTQKPQYVTPIVGFDIGCGASCVYGLLGARHCGWQMLVSDTNAQSLVAAAHNVRANNMADQVMVVQGSPVSLFSAVEQEGVQQFLAKVRAPALQEGEEPMDTDNNSSSPCDGEGYLLDFSMCNPPFFSSEQDADSCSKTKKQRSSPNNAPTGALHETVADGGEVAFITKMIKESVLYKDKVRVFSSLVGTADDLKKVRQAVAAVAPLHSTVTEFCQGRTMRWGIAWSWSPRAPLGVVVSRKKHATAKPVVLHWPRVSCLPVYTVTAAWEAITAWLADIKIKPKVFKSSKYFVGATMKAYKVTWQNQRGNRRKNKHGATAHNDECALSPGSSHNSESIASPEHHISSPTSCDAKRELEDADDGGADTTKRRRLNDTDDDTDEDDEEEDALLHADTNGGGCSNGVDKPAAQKAGGKPCLLKVNIHVKLVNNQLMVEMHVVGGLLGKDGANQLMQLFKNRLPKQKNQTAMI